jgi:hypothetical protein
MIERSFFLLGSVCYRMFGIDPQKAGFGDNADPGNLARCHSTDPVFKSVPTLTLRNSFDSCRLKLWDEQQRRLVSFRGIRR